LTSAPGAHSFGGPLRTSRGNQNTIRRAERAEDATSLTAANDLAVCNALEAAGIEFIDENGGGPGVWLRERLDEKSAK
jgi:hypothetical protein